jgi:hypothetical protein
LTLGGVRYQYLDDVPRNAACIHTSVLMTMSSACKPRSSWNGGDTAVLMSYNTGNTAIRKRSDKHYDTDSSCWLRRRGTSSNAHYCTAWTATLVPANCQPLHDEAPMYDRLLLLACSWWKRYFYLKERTLRMMLRLADVAATLEGARSLVLASLNKMRQSSPESLRSLPVHSYLGRTKHWRR